MKLLQITIIIFLLALIFFPSRIMANEATISANSSVATPSSSYELFWPLTAGKTRADGFGYKLKRFKENLRQMFLFTSAVKADYKIFLSTKRLIEAEKLWQEKNNTEAKNSLQESKKDIDQAVKEIGDSKELVKEKKENLTNQLNNIIMFTHWNMDQVDIDQSVRDELVQLNIKAKELLRKI